MSESTARITPPTLPATESAGYVLVGPPNVGKSVLFGALTDRYVTVSNYPGTTVEISAGAMHLDGQRVPVLDTPGSNSLIPSSEDERVTRDILLDGPRTVVAVGDAKNLERLLVLALQLSEMELPHVICLNMMDEAQGRGIAIDLDELSRDLGVELIPTVAVERRGLTRLRGSLSEARAGCSRVRYPSAIESAVEQIAPVLPESPISRRALALMVLAGDETLVDWLRERIPADERSRIEDTRQQLRRALRESVLNAVQHARIEEARKIARRAVTRNRSAETVRRRWGQRFEQLSIHPVWGWPVLAAVLWLCYQFVGVLGAGTAVDFLETGVFERWVNPAATAAVERLLPWTFFRDMLVGDYGIITMALTYALALVLPIVATFFIAFGFLEDSGYLPRLAVVLDRLFRKMGLNGKAVLPMVLGLGCDTMATLTTRILETPKERLIVILLLSLGVPCSAQLTVILAMLGSLSWLAMAIWVGVVVGVILVVGRLASAVLPGRGSDFIIELPPMRLPRISNILLKTLARIEWYLKEAVPLFVLGTLILFLADRFGALEIMRRFGEPVVAGLLGLPRETSEIFLIGFLRRDFGAAGLYTMAQEGTLDGVQVVVAAVTITLFIPCIAQFFMTVKERGWRTGLAIAGFVFPFALLVGSVLNWTLRLLALPLR